MAAAGVVHRPGMAAELLAEIAPLLADEGVDLDNTEGVDLDALNAALARATDRHNMELFTPVGERRRQALAVLRRFVAALDHGDDESAVAVLAEVEPEPTAELPAASHVIGAGMGLLDTWHTDPGLREMVLRARTPEWRAASEAAARSILVRARAGAGFDSLGELHRRHHGFAIFEGTALAVATCLFAVADSRGTDVEPVAAKLLAENPPLRSAGSRGHLHVVPELPSPGRRTAKKKGRKASGHPARRDQPHAYRMELRGFEAWLRRQDSIAAPTLEAELGTFEILVGVARQSGFDPYTALGTELLADELLELGDDILPGLTEAGLCTLHDYVHYRMDTVGGPEWESALSTVEDALDEVTPSALEDAIEKAELIDVEERRAAFAATRIVAAVPRLLQWIGSGRATSPSGGVRRADIAEVAAMLGVNAVGVNKLPPYQPDLDAAELIPSIVHALSMRDVPLLVPWWKALQVAEVIETTATKVRCGPSAHHWRDGATPPIEVSEMIIGFFVAEVLTQNLRSRGMFIYEERVLMLTVARLMRLVTEEDRFDIEESPLDQWLNPRVLRKLCYLEQAGVLDRADDGQFSASAPLCGVIARGLVVTSAILDQVLEPV